MASDALLPKENWGPTGLGLMCSIYVGLGLLLMGTYVWGILSLNENFGANKR